MKYKVIKEWAGVEVGKEFESKKPIFEKMVKDGYLEKIQPIKAKVEPSKRKKKIEIVDNRKKK